MIEVRGLTARFDETVALRDVDLTIGDGEFLALVGANGSGKTTLARHFNALREPEEGTVRVDGTAVADDPVAARTAVGMVFQHPRDQFVAATVGTDVAFGPENLGLERAAIDRRVERALSAVDMADREDDLVEDLSGGEQARVAIAGALAMEPDHLVLDEPLAGLDYPARQSVLERLAAVHEAGTGVVAITHDLRDLHELCDRIVGLADGEIAVDGTPPDVLDELPAIGVRDPRC